MQVLCVAVLVSITPLALCQVSHSIDQDEDLLAVDSIDNEVGTLHFHLIVPLKRDYSFVFHVSFRRPILPPPPSFAKVGARLVTAPRAPNRGPQQLTAVAGELAGIVGMT